MYVVADFVDLRGPSALCMEHPRHQPNTQPPSASPTPRGPVFRIYLSRVSAGPQRQSAAYRFAKQYDCMDVPDVYDPNPRSASQNGRRGRHERSDSAAGSVFGDASTNGGSSSRDMVASVGDVKPSIRQFDGKSECYYCCRHVHHRQFLFRQKLFEVAKNK